MDFKTEMGKWVLMAIEATYLAGAEIMNVYQTDFDVDHKEDHSPLTLADRKAHQVIAYHLRESDLPMLSEEGREIPYSERRNWKRFWMVDPLDGTKEFVKRNGEFTVNIALIEEGLAVAGVIYVPVPRDLYFGTAGEGSYKVRGIEGMVKGPEEIVKKAMRMPLAKSPARYTAIGSRSHLSEESKAFFERLREKHGDIDIVSMGSSLKICLVAEGAANIYPRFGPTMEWDTAAGHAIAKGAGKNIVDHSTDQELRYNKENLRNSGFTVS